MPWPDFKLERFFARHEFETPFLLCCSDCETLTVGDVLTLEDDATARFQRLGLGYTEAPGGRSLRQRIAALYQGIDPDQILVFSGAEEGIFTFGQSVLSAGDHVIVHWPCYQSLYQVAQSLGCRVSLWRAEESHGWELNMEDLCRLLEPQTKAVFINNPHNPTGALLPPRFLKELAELAAERNFIVFSDEVYRYLEYDPADRCPAFCDLNDQAVSLNVMSKSFGLAGLRLGWIATKNNGLYQAMASFKDYTTICNSAPSEFLAELALTHAEKIISRNLALIRENLALLNNCMERWSAVFRWTRPKAGPIAFPGLATGLQSEDFCRDLRVKKGVLLLPGSLYADEFDMNFRIGFGRRNMPEALGRLEEYLWSLTDKYGDHQ